MNRESQEEHPKAATSRDANPSGVSKNYFSQVTEENERVDREEIPQNVNGSQTRMLCELSFQNWVRFS